MGLVDLIFRSSYLLTKFRPRFIQGSDNITTNVARHCKAKFMHYEVANDVLIDVCPFVDLWVLGSEISRSNELRSKLPNTHLIATDVSELIFDDY